MQRCHFAARDIADHQACDKYNDEGDKQREARIEADRSSSHDGAVKANANVATVLSKSDQLFVAGYTKELNIDAKSLGDVVQALRRWELTSGSN